MKEQAILNSYDHQRLNHTRKLPWIMKQTWLDTLFIHYPVKKEELTRIVPPSLPIDTYDGMGWVSIVPYLTSSVRVRGMPPVPGIRQFAGFNIRTYVNLNGKPGVYFFSLAAANWISAKMAKQLFKLPYFYLNINFNRTRDIKIESDHFRKNGERVKWAYRPTSEQRLAAKGSLEEWLVERYCLYTVNREGEPMRSDILHQSWLLHDAEAEFQHNSILSEKGILTLDINPILHYSKKVEVQIWPIIPC